MIIEYTVTLVLVKPFFNVGFLFLFSQRVLIKIDYVYNPHALEGRKQNLQESENKK